MALRGDPSKIYRCMYNGERKKERDCVREKGGNDKERERWVGSN